MADQWILGRRNRRLYSELSKQEMEQLTQEFRIMYRENFQEIKDMLAVAFGIPFDSVSA